MLCYKLYYTYLNSLPLLPHLSLSLITLIKSWFILFWSILWFILFWSVDQDYSLVFFLILYNFSRYSEYLCAGESQAPEARVVPYKLKESLERRERERERRGGGGDHCFLRTTLLPKFDFPSPLFGHPPVINDAIQK